jgi:hypothetical protein
VTSFFRPLVIVRISLMWCVVGGGGSDAWTNKSASTLLPHRQRLGVDGNV